MYVVLVLRIPWLYFYGYSSEIVSVLPAHTKYIRYSCKYQCLVEVLNAWIIPGCSHLLKCGYYLRAAPNKDFTVLWVNRYVLELVLNLTLVNTLVRLKLGTYFLNINLWYQLYFLMQKIRILQSCKCYRQPAAGNIHGPNSGGKKLQQSNLKLGGVLQFFSHIYDYCHRLNSERIRNTTNISV